MLCLTADASDQTADDAQCQEEEQDQSSNADWTLEECDECTLHVGLVDIRLNFTLKLFLIQQEIKRVEFVSNMIPTKIVYHALRLLVLARILVLENGVNGSIDTVVSDSFDHITFDQSEGAGGEESNQDKFAG